MAYYILLPDGRNVEFPDDYPRDQAQAVAARMAGESQRPAETAPAQPQRGSNLGLFGDVVGSAISGAGGIASAGGGLYGLATGDYDTGATRLGRRVQQYGETFMSPQLLEARERLDREMKEAEGQGLLTEAGVAARGILTDPRLATSFVAEQVPQFIGSLGVGRVAGGIGQLAARRGGAEAAQAAGRTAAVGAAIGTGTGLQTGEVANSTYEDIIKLAPEVIERSPNYQALRQTMTDEEARHQLGVEGSRVAAAIAAPISAGTAALFGAERFALGDQIKRRAIARVVLGATGEATQEGIEEGGGQFAQNVGALRAETERDLAAGVGGAAARGAILGGIIGGGTGLISGRAPDQTVRGEDADLRGAIDPFLSSIRRTPGEMSQPDVADQVRLVTENLPITAEQFLGTTPEAQDRLVARAEREAERRQSGQNLDVLDPQGNRDRETANVRAAQSASRPSNELISGQAGSRAEAFQFEEGRGERTEGGATQAELFRQRAAELQRLTEQFPQIATTRVRDEATGNMRLLNAGERREMGLRLLEERGGQPTAAEATVAAAGQTFRPSLGTGAEQTAAAARATRPTEQPVSAFFPLVENFIEGHVRKYGSSQPLSVPAFQQYLRGQVGETVTLNRAREIFDTYHAGTQEPLSALFPAVKSFVDRPSSKKANKDKLLSNLQKHLNATTGNALSLRQTGEALDAYKRSIGRTVKPSASLGAPMVTSNIPRGRGWVLQRSEDASGSPTYRAIAPKGVNTDEDGRPLPPAAPPAAPLRAGPSGFTDPRQRELSARAGEAQAPQAEQAEAAQDTKAVKRATEIVNDRLNKIEKRGGKKAREAVEKVIRDGKYDAEQVYAAFMAADRIASLLPVGASHEIEFVDRLLVSNAEAAKASGNVKAQEAQGERVRQTGKINQARFNQLMREGLTADQAFAVVQKEAVNGIIRLSLAPNQLPFLGETAAHEAFHVLQDYYAKYDPQFKNLMDKSFRNDMMIADVDPTIRRKLEQARFPGSDKSYWQVLSATLPNALTAREAQAYVFGSLVDAAKRGTPMTGLKPAFARFVNFLRQFFTRMGNTMRGDGFQTAESMLARVGRGDAQRFGGRAAPTDEDFAAKAPELSARASEIESLAAEAQDNYRYGLITAKERDAVIKNLGVRYEVIDRTDPQNPKVVGSYTNRARARSEAEKRDLQYGAYRFSVKPVVPSELSARVVPPVPEISSIPALYDPAVVDATDGLKRVRSVVRAREAEAKAAKEEGREARPIEGPSAKELKQQQAEFEKRLEDAIKRVYGVDEYPEGLDGTATLIQDASRKALGQPIYESSPETDKILSETLAAEVIEALVHTEAAGKKNAKDWYTQNIRNAMAIASLLHPELTSDAAASAEGFKSSAEARVVFTGAMAITSQDMDVKENAKAAEAQYRVFKARRAFDSTQSYGSKAEAISNNLKLFNTILYDRFGGNLTEMGEFLNKKFIVRDLAQSMSEMGVGISGELMDQQVYGSMVFGPKIGNGFYQNLNANFDPVTIDKWLMRTWGRITGNLIGNPELGPEQAARLMRGMNNAIDASFMRAEDFSLINAEIKKIEAISSRPQTKKADRLTEGENEYLSSMWDLFVGEGSFDGSKGQQSALLEAMRDFGIARSRSLPFGTVEQFSFSPDMNDDQQARELDRMTKFANEIVRWWNRTYLSERRAGKSNDEVLATQPLFVLAAKSIVTQQSKPKDNPGGGEFRRWVRSVVADTQNILRENGYDMTAADIQAVLWYPEKYLWKALGTRLDKELDVSYEEAFKEIARGRGKTEEAIGAVLRPLERDGRRGDEAAGRGAEQAVARADAGRSEAAAQPVAEFGARDGRAGLTNEQAELSARATNTTVPEFKNWWTGGWRGEDFKKKESVARNRDGSPQQYYHGTPRSFSVFGGATSGALEDREGPFFLTPKPEFTAGYTGEDALNPQALFDRGEAPRVLPVFVSVQNPFDSTDPKRKAELISFINDVARSGRLKFRDILSNNFASYKEEDVQAGLLTMEEAIKQSVERWRDQLNDPDDNWRAIEAPLVQKYIRGNGFDGFYITEYGSKNLAVYDPRQIKSVFNRFEAGAATQPEFSARQVDATGIGTRVNNATPSNVRNKEFEIQYTRASDLVDRGLRKIPFVGKRLKPGAGEDLIILMQDRMLPLGRMVDVVRKNGGNVVDASDIYMTEELYHGRVGAAVDDRAQRLYKPVFDEMRRLNISLKDMDEYLEARHAPERNAFVKSINEDPSKGAGITDKEAAAIMQRLAPQKAKLDRVAKLVDAIVADTNKTRAESGLTPDYGKLNSKTNFKYYVPLRGFVEEDIFDDKGVESLRARTGQGFKIKGKEDRSIMGRTSRASNILGNVILQNEETVIRSEKNKVGQALVKLIRDNPQQSAGFAKILDKTPVEPRIVNGKVKLMASGLYKNRDDVMVVKEGGNEIAVEIYDERLAKALTGASGLGAENSSMVLRGLAGLNRYLATINTTLNPEFLISNFARDLQTANINIKQYDTKGLGRKIISDVPMALAGARAAIRGGDMSGKWAQAYEDFRRAGGTTEYLGLRDIDSKLKQINNEVMGNKGPLVVRPFKTMLKLIEDYNSVAENAIRLSTFQALRDMGVSDAKAAQVAKNLTVNFNKGGQNRVLMNSLYLFYNASIQGSMAMINAIARSKRVRKYVAAIVTAGFMHDVINAMLSGMDEDERKIYDKIPENVLERNYVLMDPFGLTERGYYAFPMPYGFNAFFNMGRNLSRASRGEGEPMKTAGSIVMGFVDAFNPVGGTQSFFNFVAPTILDPFVDLYSNRNFANRPIVPEERGFGPPSPDSQRFWSNTFPPYVTVSQWLNQITGGTSVIPGQVDISPNTIGYLMNYAFGAAGAFAERVAKFGFSTVPDMLTGDLEEVEVRDIPFVRKLYGNVTTRNDLESFMENTNRIGQIQREFKEAERFGEGERMERAMQDYPRELAIAPLIEGLVRERRKITREMNEIRRDPNIDAESRRELLRVLKQEADLYVGQVNQLYNTQVRR